MKRALPMRNRVDSFLDPVSKITGVNILHDNEVRAGLMLKAFKEMRKLGYVTFDVAQLLLQKSSGTKGLELGSMILAEAADAPPTQAFKLLLTLCDHSNWEVREYAGESLGTFLIRHFKRFESKLISLHKARSENVRRGIVLAIKYLGKHRGAVPPESLLNVLGHYMDDTSGYVKRNLGPFAIGDALLLYYPIETLAFLNRFSKAKLPQARWNVASAFTTSVGAKSGPKALSLLYELGQDLDRNVRETAAKALLNVAQRNPSRKASILQRLRQMAERELFGTRTANRIKLTLQ